MHYTRITIDALMPKRERSGSNPDDAISFQYPVSEWIGDIREWYDFTTWLSEYKPITGYGILYGSQNKDDDKVIDVDARLAEFRSLPPEQVMPYFERLNREKMERLQKVIARIDEFLQNFPKELYAATYAMGLDP